ncbi:MAG: hypothetical protein LBF81_05345 [Prevotellaceae bacterium]|jgi:NTP pyrophosphatase (non-canonical NTP hydrolase)|nr:hypothetical protein [Prevotellaceae bacterium]
MKAELNQLRDEIHKNAVEKGFYDFEQSVPNGALAKEVEHAFFAQKIALIHSELGEALNADRCNAHAHLSKYDNFNIFYKEAFEFHIKDTVEDELADVIIRTLDLCGHLDIDIEKHVELKMQYNQTRAYMHDKKY